ncbi:MAG: hypothetical protein Aureis2KO_18670 [Aureisphaera sp.]
MKKINRIILGLAILLCISNFGSLYAQGPNSPEAASFEPVDATDMVNLITGDFSYVLPVINVPSPEGGYPLTLSYHAGVTVDQEASWTGLGWSLNPGAINRSVNGYPDDWKHGLVKEMAYDEGGSEYSASVSIGVGIPGKWSVGVGVSWGSNRSLGGSVSLSIAGIYGSIGTDGVSAGYGFSDNFGVGLSVGFNGSFGIGANLGVSKDGALSLNMGIGYGPGGLNGSLGLSKSKLDKDGNLIRGKSSGIGVSLSSSGLSVSGKANGFGTSVSASFGKSISKSDYTVRQENNSFMIVTPWAFFSFGKNKVSWELKSISNFQTSGAIFSYHVPGGSYGLDGSDFNITSDNSLRNKDAYEVSTQSTFEQSKEDSYIKNHNVAFANFDNYSVDAQGIGGTISPVLANNIRLYPFSGMWLEDSNTSITHTNLEGTTVTEKPVYFNFKSFNSSFLNVLPYDISYVGGEAVYNTALPPSPPPPGFSYNSDQTLIHRDGLYDEPNHRIKQGRHVEYFTVEDIRSGVAETKGFLDVDNNFVRDVNSCGYVGEGFIEINFRESIGAFKVTAQDGKTYHYSLPVYQGEEVRRLYGIVDDKTEDQAQMDRMKLDMYATHWLLTAITGPDYIKMDPSRKFPDEGDYGYWVRFEYGKWSNGYIWKTPNGKYSESVDVFDKAKEYSWGRKQIYYLDKIKTRTHTALFSKTLRRDNKSEAMVYKNMYHRESGSTNYMQMGSHPLLALDKIILLKNEHANGLSKAAGAPLAATQNYSYAISGTYGRDPDCPWRTCPNVWQERDYYLRQFDVNLNDNVFDENDFAGLNIEDNALKVIKFNYDYSSAYGAPNSDLGKLTLKNVHFRGKGGIGLIPSIRFRYASNYSYNAEKRNDFGYHKDNPQAWSLNQITTPTGANINIYYEPDTYDKVAIKNGRVFTSKLKFSFLIPPPEGGSNPDTAPEGITRIKIEIDDQDDTANDLVLSEYFDPSQPFFMDMWYSAVYNHSGAGYDRSSVNIDSKMATITELNTAGNYMIVEVMASSPFFRDVFQHSAEPVSVLHAGGSYNGVENQNHPRFDLAWTPEQGWRKYSMRHTVIANKHRPDNESGIRVQRIAINDSGSNYTTSYSYIDPNTNTSSGIISYYPEPHYNITQQVPYVSLLPSPVVTYKYVTETNSDLSRQYKFKVLEELVQNATTVSFGEFLEIECSEENPATDTNIKELVVKNNLNSLGNVEEIKVFNSEGQLTSKVNNSYHTADDFYSVGQFTQSFYTSKQVTQGSSSKYFHNVGSKADIYNNLNLVSEKKNNFESTTEYAEYSPLTNQILATITEDSKGNRFKNEIIPAYTVAEYNPIGGYGMGSAFDNPTNRNMLTQVAIEKAYLEHGGEWKETGVGITTWSNKWTYSSNNDALETPSLESEKIWRKHKTYVWNGEVDENGIYENYVGINDNFNWTVGNWPDGSLQTNPDWRNIATVTRYDHYSLAIEAKDINGNFTISKMCDNDTKVLFTANSGYYESFNTGAEYYDTATSRLDPQVRGNASLRTTEKAHTGQYSLKITTSDNSFGAVLKGGNHRAGKYKMSVWVHKDNYSNARFKQTYGGALQEFNGEKIFAGDWVQLNHYFDRSESQTSGDTIFMVASLSGTIYVDDYRLHPISTSINSYVYNSWDELEYILDENNLATYFVYDAAGRFLESYNEVVDDAENGIVGGFKLSEKNYYRYKNQ